jgi:hypothetical protein
MAIVKHSNEVTVLVYADQSGEVYYRNQFNSPIDSSEAAIERWHKWLHVLNTAEQYPGLSEAITDIEVLYELIRPE